MVSFSAKCSVPISQSAAVDGLHRSVLIAYPSLLQFRSCLHNYNYDQLSMKRHQSEESLAIAGLHHGGGVAATAGFSHVAHHPIPDQPAETEHRTERRKSGDGHSSAPHSGNPSFNRNESEEALAIGGVAHAGVAGVTALTHAAHHPIKHHEEEPKHDTAPPHPERHDSQHSSHNGSFAVAGAAQGGMTAATALSHANPLHQV